ncbi:MAG: hypothetical protein KBE22_06775 [Candidatus Accumulibacter sp.]|uniref:Uncharacterized protein n=1 Tax=Candidatus Accumulibacter affinis TaxID=2954384 RepID=A0A935T5X2_9PROT|nr:hypothetical protein [Candidatus Accumulibacter affinis]MBP9804591.1 hypothetical protein [Accumulibacter sp.]
MLLAHPVAGGEAAELQVVLPSRRDMADITALALDQVRMEIMHLGETVNSMLPGSIYYFAKRMANTVLPMVLQRE